MNQKEAAEYRKAKNAVKEKFKTINVGEQIQYINQSQLFKPLLETQKETQKAIENKLISGQEILSNALIPFTTELKKRNDQVDELQSQPFYNSNLEIEDVPQSTPKKKDSVNTYDLDKFLDDSDRQNLVDMSLPLPSEVAGNGNYDDIITEAKKLNHLYGCKAGKKSNQDEKMKEMYKSRQKTLEKYKESLNDHKPADKYKLGKGFRKQPLYRIKRGRGRPRTNPEIIIVNDIETLKQELYNFVTAKNAGNTGLDNNINSVLDALLKNNEIDIDKYRELYKEIFKKD